MRLTVPSNTTQAGPLIFSAVIFDADWRSWADGRTRVLHCTLFGKNLEFHFRRSSGEIELVEAAGEGEAA